MQNMITPEILGIVQIYPTNALFLATLGAEIYVYFNGIHWKLVNISPSDDTMTIDRYETEFINFMTLDLRKKTPESTTFGLHTNRILTLRYAIEELSSFVFYSKSEFISINNAAMNYCRAIVDGSFLAIPSVIDPVITHFLKIKLNMVN